MAETLTFFAACLVVVGLGFAGYGLWCRRRYNRSRARMWRQVEFIFRGRAEK